MEDSKRNVLRKLRMHISTSMEARKAVEFLYSRGVLDENDRENILAETTAQYKVLKLLDMLPRMGSEAFDVFLQALHGCGYGFLAKNIQSELSGKTIGDGNESKPSNFGLLQKVPKFVGRAEVCGDITRSLTADGDDSTRLITVVAPPGFGKTAVAINVGHMVLDKGKDVLYVSLRTVTSVACAAEHMLETVGIPVTETPVLQVKSYLASLQRETLLILDNAEDLQVKEGAHFNQFLEDIGQQARNLVTLITSRILLSKLDFPFLASHVPLKPLDEDESSVFLKNQAPNISDQYVRLFSKPKVCGGVPLVLKITAAFLKNKTIDPIELHRKLQNCPHNFLKVNNPKIQELFLLLKVFYNHLQPAVKKALASLAAFPTVFTKVEAKDVLFPDEDYLGFQILLNDLESHSLVQQDEVNNHVEYSLHPLVQAFCIASREDVCKGYNMAIRLFSGYYLSLLRQLNDDFITTNCKIAIDKYQTSKMNICHALVASAEDELLKHYGLRVSTETVNFLAKVMNMEEFTSSYDKFLEVAKKLPEKTLYSECLVSIGFKQLCYYGYNDAYRTDAKRNLQEAHDLQTRLTIHDTECHGHCKCKLGLCTFISGDTKKGISLIAQGIGVRRKLVRTSGSGKMERMLLAGGFCDLGMAMFHSGKYRAAVNIWENICLVKYRELLGTHPFTASLLDYIGKVYQELGYPRQAVVFKKESLAMRCFLLGEDHLDTARAYYGLGCALEALGSTDEALENLNKAHNVQVRFLASKQDIERTKEKINSLRGRVRTESPCRILQHMHIENYGVACHSVVTPLTT